MTDGGDSSANGNGGTGSSGGWPDDVDDGILYQLAWYYRELGRSLRSASFGWPKATTSERAAYLDELGALREKEREVWAAYFARPVTTKGTP